MPFSAGTFTRLYNWTTDKANSIRVRADRMDAEFDGIASGLSKAILKDGTQTVTANIPMSGFKFTGLGEPSADSDSATKGYVDDNVTALTNFTVRVATTASVTIATAFNNGDTLDGVSLVDGDLVLAKNQSTASQNGVYVVGAVPARSTSFDTWNEHVNSIINVTAGSTNAGLSFRCTVNAGGVLDTTDITYVQFGSSVTLPLPIASGGTGQTAAPAALGALINGATAENSVAADDAIALYDTSESTGNKATVSDFLKVVNALTEDSTPDASADYTLTYDTSATAPKKVRLSNLASGIPVGAVTSYAGTSAPSGWLFCYGQAVSRTTYASLFSSISTTYGTGDGSTTFNLPDMRGRVAAGKDDMGGTSANRLTNQTGGLNGDNLGATGGAETHALTAAQTPNNDDPGDNGQSASGGGSVDFAAKTHTGTGNAHNNLQPTIILNYIIYAAA